MAFKNPEKSGTWGALDADCVAEGEPVSGHVLRELYRNANMLSDRTQPLYRYVKPSTNQSAHLLAYPIGAHYVSILPGGVIPIVKMPHQQYARARFRFKGSSGWDFTFQVGSSAMPAATTAGTSDHVKTAAGNGSTEVTVDFSNIYLGTGSTTSISFAAKAVLDPATDSLWSGGNNTGSLQSLDGNFLASTALEGWQTSRPESDTYVVVDGGASNPIIYYMGTVAATFSDNLLMVSPAGPTITEFAAASSRWRLFDAPLLTPVSFSLYSKEQV